MSKKKWDKLPLMTWKFTMYKEDEQGNQKFYEYTGDHSFCTNDSCDECNLYPLAFNSFILFGVH